MRKFSFITARRLVKISALSFSLFIALFYGVFHRQEGDVYAQDEITPSAARFSESFDSVSSPALPAGWTTSTTGANARFVTTSATPDSAPNAIFTNNPATAGSAEITSPEIQLGSLPARLVFRHFYNTETTPGFDGGVLEISVAGGAFQDILAAGGAFVTGGYVRALSSNATGNPLLGRQVWTGNSAGYITSVVNLPSGAANQSVRLRWRYGTDQIEGGVGWRIDGIQIIDDPPVSQTGYFENFDGIAAPQLPPNWSTSQTGVGVAFVTRSGSADTTPNSAFTPNPSNVGSSELISPSVRVGANSPKLIFRNLFDAETNFDGGVLEIKIGNGSFQDIITAGGSFITGGYNSTLSNQFGNPLGGRRAWSGRSGGTTPASYISTEVNLPPAAYQQTVQFRWRFGSDNVIGRTGWNIDSIRVTNAVTGENPGAIAISNSGAASPYPSRIQVSELTGKVTKVTVNLTNFSHTAPDDVDIMLVSPSGRSVILMSDAGGSTAAGNLNMTLEDAAGNSLPDSGPLVSGSFKPTDFESGDSFPGPAPQGAPTGTKLGAFFNDEPNGEWKLFAVDDTDGNAGSITGGWSIIIETSNTAIGIPDVGASQPYPSEITVAGRTGLVSKVTVSLENFSHSAPDDVDLMLVAPNGRKVILMSDAGGGTEVRNLALTFDDAAPALLPDSSALASGSFKPTDFEQSDVFPAPAPTGNSPGGRMLAALNGSEPNGTWKLFLVDDSGNHAGTISAWSLSLQTSEGAVVIPESGISQPYPSDFIVSGMTGSVTKVTVSLSNFSHTAPDDADLLLVAPNGRSVVIMSDAGGSIEVGGLNITLDDTAATALPDGGPLVSGTFKPTNYEQGDAFPLPAPGGAPTGSALQNFYGIGPNGVWKLYVVDDAGGNFGSIAGSWSLSVQSSIGACQFNLSTSGQAFPVSGGGGSFQVQMPTGCPWTAAANNSFINISSGSSGEGAGTVSFTVAPNSGPSRTGTITVTNGAFSRTFQIQQASGCPFSISQSTISFAASGGTGSVQVSAGEKCTWQAAANVDWISVPSAPQTGSSTLAFNVQPNPGREPRNGVITIGGHSLAVIQTGAAGRRFDFDGDGRADVSAGEHGFCSKARWDFSHGNLAW